MGKWKIVLACLLALAGPFASIATAEDAGATLREAEAPKIMEAVSGLVAALEAGDAESGLLFFMPEKRESYRFMFGEDGREDMANALKGAAVDSVVKAHGGGMLLSNEDVGECQKMSDNREKMAAEYGQETVDAWLDMCHYPPLLLAGISISMNGMMFHASLVRQSGKWLFEDL